MDKRKVIVIAVLVLFVIGMSMSAASANKNVKVGRYKVKLTSSDIKKIKKGKQITKQTGKYKKYKDASTGKIKKAKVKISVSKTANDGATKKGKYYAESWSSAGPIDCKWIKL